MSRSTVARRAREHCREARAGAEGEAAWRAAVEAWRGASPDSPSDCVERALGGAGPTDGTRSCRRSRQARTIATRVAGGKALNAIATRPWLVGGDADLVGPHRDRIRRRGPLRRRDSGGRNIHFGIREHAMGGDRQRDGLPRRVPAVRRDLLGLLGLHAAVRCGWPRSSSSRTIFVSRTTRSASAKTARRTSPSSTCWRCARCRIHDHPAGRRERDGDGLAGRDGAGTGRGAGARAPARSCPARPFEVAAGGRRSARGVRPGESRGAATPDDPDGDGLRAAARLAGAGEPRGRGSTRVVSMPCWEFFDGAATGLPRRGPAAFAFGRAFDRGGHRRSVGSGGSATGGLDRRSTASARRGPNQRSTRSSAWSRVRRRRLARVG